MPYSAQATSHGGVRKFAFEVSRITPPPIGTSQGGLRYFGFEAGRILTPPAPMSYVGAGVWKLIAVSPEDTVSSLMCIKNIYFMLLLKVPLWEPLG